MQGSYILIVDPDKELVGNIQNILTAEGCKSVGVFDGETALHECEKELPRIVLLEGLLPKINGIELAKKIRELPEGGLVSILLISAVYTSSKFTAEIKKAKIDDILPKPFLPLDLIKKIRAFQLQVRESGLLVADEKLEDFPQTGFLSETPFIDIVARFYEQKTRGTLRLQNATTKKLVTFENGEPMFVVSNLERECLGKLLVKTGRITDEQCSESLRMMGEQKKRQGEILIQMGLLQPYELEDVLKQQAREKFSEIFGWTQGQYIFVPGKVFKKELTPVDISLEQLCLRGVKEHYSISKMQESLFHFVNEKPLFSNDVAFRLDRFKFAAWDLKIVKMLQRGQSISSVLETQLARETDVYHLSYTLFKLHLIRFESEKKLAPGEPTKSVFEDRRTPFEIVGTTALASDDEIQQAFTEKMTQLKGSEHGDVEILKLREAFGKILTLPMRIDYLIRKYEETGTLTPDAKALFKADEFLNVGKNFLEKKNFKSAQKVFAEAIELFPENGILFSYMGLALFLDSTVEPVDQKKRNQGLKAMKKATQLAPNDAEPPFILGKVFAMEKRFDLAITEMQKVLEINPKHQQAISELRLAQHRIEKQQSLSFIRWKK